MPRTQGSKRRITAGRRERADRRHATRDNAKAREPPAVVVHVQHDRVLAATVGIEPDLSEAPDPVLPLLPGVLDPVEEPLGGGSRAAPETLELGENVVLGPNDLVQPRALERGFRGCREVGVRDVRVRPVEPAIRLRRGDETLHTGDRRLLREESCELTR